MPDADKRLTTLPDSAVRNKFTDTMDIDQAAPRLYYGDNWSGGLDVFDISTREPNYLQTIRMRGMLYGVSVATNVSKVFVGLSMSLVAVVDIDPASSMFHTVVAQVDTGGRGAADLMDNDPVDKKLFVGMHDDGFVASIDAVNNKLLKRIDGLGGEIEQPRFNPHDGMVYVAGRVDNELYQIDPKTDTLVARIPIGDPCHPNAREKWFNTADFRRALSLGIDRDQLNETFWLGLGTPTSMAPADTNKYNPGPQFRTMWATFDPKQSNDLLDKIGLDKKDPKGFRLRQDGTGRLRMEITTLGGQFVQFTQIMEVIRQQWTKIGIDLTVQERERSLAEKMAGANETQLYAWLADGSEHLFTFPDHVFPYNASTEAAGVLYAQWFQSAGTKGEEPPPKIKEIMDKFKKGFTVPEEERVKLGKEIWQTVIEEVHTIATVGLSPAAQGTRIVKNTMGNIPTRMYNSPDGKTPGISRTPTYYFKA